MERRNLVASMETSVYPELKVLYGDKILGRKLDRRG